MKTKTLGRLLGCLSLAVLSASAQSGAQKTNATQAEAMELLRRTIAEQQSNPKKVIRTLTPTNAPSATNHPATLPAPTSSTFAELERQYLQGKITAKQYQKTFEQLQEQKKRAEAEGDKARLLEALRQQQTTAPRQPAPNPPATRPTSPGENRAATATAPAGAAPAPAAAPELTPQQKKLSEVEARIEEMIRQKTAREKAALTNAVATTNSIASGPQTRRQRLDALLKQYVDGTLSEADYKEKRGKILAEP